MNTKYLFKQNILQSFAFAQLGQCKATVRSLLISWGEGSKNLEVQTSEGPRIMGLMRDYLAALRATAKYARALKDYQGTDNKQNYLIFCLLFFLKLRMKVCCPSERGISSPFIIAMRRINGTWASVKEERVRFLLTTWSSFLVIPLLLYPLFKYALLWSRMIRLCTFLIAYSCAIYGL